MKKKKHPTRAVLEGAESVCVWGNEGGVQDGYAVHFGTNHRQSAMPTSPDTRVCDFLRSGVVVEDHQVIRAGTAPDGSKNG